MGDEFASCKNKTVYTIGCAGVQGDFKNGVGFSEALIPHDHWNYAIYGKYIWLPRIEDAIELMGDKLLYIQRGRKGEYFCEVLLGLVTLRKPNKSARIACLAALKQVLEGG